MRLPVAGNISTRDGSSNKNARMTNMLAEEKQGKSFAAVRPGLNQVASTTGNGNGIVCFNGDLVNVFGATLGVIEPAEPDYTHVICLETTDTIWKSIDWVGTTIVGVGGAFGNKVYNSTDEGETTSLVSTAPVTPEFPNGLINKNGQLYLLYNAGSGSGGPGVYRDNSDYGATWAYVGTHAVVYPCYVDGGNIYSLTVGEVLDDDEEETIGFFIAVHTTTDLTSITAATTLKEILDGNAPIGYGCMTVIDGVIHVLVASLSVLYHFKYQSGVWSYTTQAFTANEYVSSSKRCYAIGSKIYFITFAYPSTTVTLRTLDYSTDELGIYYSLAGVSEGNVSQQLIYNGTTLSVCFRFGDSMEYHHFTNIGSYDYDVVTTAALNENEKYDFTLIP